MESEKFCTLDRQERTISAVATVLTADELASYRRDGFVRVVEAFPHGLAIQCRELLWNQLEELPDDPTTWTRAVVQIGIQTDSSFSRAAKSPRWLGAIHDVAGPEAAPRMWMHGTFAVGFPVEDDPRDHRWHIEGSYLGPDGSWWVNHRSESRALLMLVLFSDIGSDDAPTRLRVGSHREIPDALLPYGDEGVSSPSFQPPPKVHELPLAFATGEPGDVYLCHPFLVHAAQRHHGTHPRFLGRVGVPWKGASPGLPRL
jgi:hypothetical protein